MTNAEVFRTRYAAALRDYLTSRDEATLAIGHELGRRALLDRISMLDIVENHFVLVDELVKSARVDSAAALQFLLQTLAALDVATRGFLDETRRYEQQRARAEDLAHRDEFRSALVNSLQEGFVVADHDGTIVEINDAFTQITGYSADGLPYRWPYPWLVARAEGEPLSRLARDGSAQSETLIRHRDGDIRCVAVSVNAVAADGADRDVYVGTVRDVTASRAAATRESAVARLATAVSVATSVADVVALALEECRTTIDVRRVVAAMWPTDDGDPAIYAAGGSESTWGDLDPDLRATFESARHRLPLTVEPVESPDHPGRSRGVIAVLSGARDVAMWFEHNEPRRVSSEDQLLVAALVGHLSLAVQHVRQFEIARETSLTLQRAMLAPIATTPTGFAVRYEPAVPPLAIGGDWYDVLEIADHRVGIIVGDCVGRGLPAAAVMGQLRSSARALLLTGAEPARLLEQLDAAAELIPGAYCATVFLGILETESQTLRYSSAGHIPALLASPQSATAALTGALSVPLAVQRNEPRPQAGCVLQPGSTLMFFTDGLVERRGDSIDRGMDRAAQVLRDATRLSVDGAADAVLRELAPANGYEDDVAIVVYRPPHGTLCIECDALAERLPDVRRQLAAWLNGAAVPDQLAADVVLAVNEACTNCIEHAYWQRNPGSMRVEAELKNTEIHARVVDSGCWREPDADPGYRGRGLVLIRAITYHVELDPTTGGTTVTMIFRLP